jgi:hypothetical protein
MIKLLLASENVICSYRCKSMIWLDFSCDHENVAQLEGKSGGSSGCSENEGVSRV